MTLIAIKSKSVQAGVCRECRQSVTLAEREDGGGVVFSGDPAGYRVTKNAVGELIEHFDAAEIHGCLK
jgi:hypothetical protein